MIPEILAGLIRKLTEGLTWKKVLFIVLGAAVTTFGVHNIHQQVGITEGGILGLMLLLNHWFGLSPAVLTPLLDALCYLLAYKCLGGSFLRISLISTGSVALFYKLWEQLPPMLPDLSRWPLLAALAGGAFVGIGVGLIVRQGGSAGGDDALALTISRATRWRLARAYLFTDVTVLALSLTYLPLGRIACSLATVTVSSFLIDRLQAAALPRPAAEAE